MDGWELTLARYYWGCLDTPEQRLYSLFGVDELSPLPYALKAIFDVEATFAGLEVGGVRYNQVLYVSGATEVELPLPEGGALTVYIGSLAFFEDLFVLLDGAPGDVLNNCAVRSYLYEYRR